jgi:hypothetical protein
LNEDEPTMALAPAALAEDAGAGAEAAAELGAVLAGADELLLFEGVEQAASASAPAVTARPAAIFLFIRNLLFVFGSSRSFSLSEARGLHKRCYPLEPRRR